MHPKFADWYQPVTFGHERDVLQFRWNGIEAILKGIGTLTALDLVLLVFQKDVIDPGNITWIRDHFKHADPTFKSEGNENELCVLAGCVLALACIEEDHAIPEAALAILTTSVCNTLVPGLGIDLLGMAQHRIEVEGSADRNRPEFSPLPAPTKKAFSTVTTSLTESPTLETVTAAINSLISSTTTLTSSLQKEIGKQIELLQKTLSVQDEELQMLWWVVGKRSNLWKKEFDEIDKKARPLLFGYESTILTKLSMESPSLKAVLIRAGIDKGLKLTIPEAINACGVDFLRQISLDVSSPDMFPLLFAIERAIETEADETWIPVWVESQD